ncbi:hypothetical protein PRUPE_8G026200 [Prunus persica]|uniref:Pentacotripeptide-repeat region of PRORP domain-containing protein n=1 Tax=Prunus persica TaxID=3760 RepID=A0A251MRU5_PRUPE|nr:pentatricopeptide repeat-containing protein At2g20710, mitochondrial [Prunus persica]XP_020426126.1 pentatricopeptide repeat-containing protein At2g20710, mitochondrial [Prunus persica]XP_020426127.1 pentatricopeptide repeat-containing protein At2g20710, mitochondrial [Prunus persica]ONH89951.1 hypothetical protein PRUPE_8G026200 [Prunus persica]ONH89952.1 hypothetical protein PRUPE_8G026200 [Prunus persica]ONH89953.1 hypothetical protein PRUPE_8G026200 [Prunus persica]ONH89954.1 hypotheti
MMKLLRSSSNPWRGYAISRVFGALFYSTEVLPSSSSSPPFRLLHSRIWQIGNPRDSILPVLHQWRVEGGDMKQPKLQGFIRLLRRYRRYGHALQISEWMSDEMKHDLHPGDIAVRLDLTSKVHGLEEAERYFDSIPESLKVLPVYGALLSCYAKHNCLEKAESVFEKMEELGFVKGSSCYNTMLNLYSQMGKHGKVDILVKEMAEKGIDYNVNTLNIRLYSYAATSDVDQMEKLLMKMETDPLVSLDWHGYAAAADAFLKAGQLEKTAALLRKSEQFINRETRKIGYEHLMTSYAAIGSKHEVYRIWELYKNVVGFYNNGYRCMLSSLLKMDDIDGAEKIVEEWESGNKFFNIQIPHLLINAYCRKGLLEKAKSYVKKLSEGGKECCRTWALLATTYHMNDRMEEAVETLKMAASSASRPGWKFDNSTLAACFEYLKQKGDVEKAHELLILFRERGHFTTDLCDKIRNYIGGCAPPGSGVR